MSWYLHPCLLFDTQPHIATPSRFVASRCGLCSFWTIFSPFDDGDAVCARRCSMELGSGLQQEAMRRPLQGPFS